MKKTLRNKKGFTLAELLIVVAIIAVLVAIAIPIFTAQLEKAREATDAANIRAAYAEVSANLLTEDDATKVTPIEVKATQTQAGWQGTDFNTDDHTIGGKKVEAVVKPNAWTVAATKNASGAYEVTITPKTGA